MFPEQAAVSKQRIDDAAPACPRPMIGKLPGEGIINRVTITPDEKNPGTKRFEDCGAGGAAALMNRQRF